MSNRNLYRLTRFVIFKFRLLLKLFSYFRRSKKRILILKTDAIGDYVLFRNFIEIVRNAEKFKGYEIDLVGNELWREIALKYDSAFIAQFVFVKPLALYEAPGKMLGLARQLFKRNYHIVLQPTYTRNLITDALAGFTAAKVIIGFESDNEVLQQKFKRRTDKFYTQKLLLPANIYFEFDRVKYFFETVLAQTINLNGPRFNIPQGNRNGIIIFPGSGSVKRSWDAGKFLSLIALIKQQTAQPIIIAGGAAEETLGNYFAQNLPPGSFVNLINKISLPALIEHISSAALIVANDSSAIHIAAATVTPAICILGGGHFDRFAPYPAHMAFKPVCVYEKMPCYYCNWVCKFETQQNEPYPCIAHIAVNDIWQATQSILATL